MTDVNVAHERVQVQAAKKRRRPQIYYTAGPGGLISSYQHSRDGNITTDVAVTYSGQLFDVCRKLDAEVYAVASSPDYPRSEELHDGVYHIRQRRCPWETWRGPMFHLGDLVGSLGHTRRPSGTARTSWSSTGAIRTIISTRPSACSGSKSSRS